MGRTIRDMLGSVVEVYNVQRQMGVTTAIMEAAQRAQGLRDIGKGRGEVFVVAHNHEGMKCLHGHRAVPRDRVTTLDGVFSKTMGRDAFVLFDNAAVQDMARRALAAINTRDDRIKVLEKQLQTFKDARDKAVIGLRNAVDMDWTKDEATVEVFQGIVSVEYDDEDPKTYAGISLTVGKRRFLAYGGDPSVDFLTMVLFMRKEFNAKEFMNSSSVDHFVMDGGALETAGPWHPGTEEAARFGVSQVTETEVEE